MILGIVSIHTEPQKKISFHNSIVLRGLLGIISGLRFFLEITHMKKNVYHKMQLFGKISAKSDAAFRNYWPKCEILPILRVI